MNIRTDFQNLEQCIYKNLICLSLAASNSFIPWGYVFNILSFTFLRSKTREFTYYEVGSRDNFSIYMAGNPFYRIHSV